MIRDVYCRYDVDKNCLHSDTLYDYIEQEMKPFTGGMNTGDITRDEAFRLFTYSRFEADAVIDNLVNMFTYSFIIFAQKEFADANFSIPYEWREGDYFSISLTKMFCQKLLEVPYYSHHHTVVYDPATNRVRNTAEYNVKGNLKRRYANNPLYKAARAIYRGLKFLKSSDARRERKAEKYARDMIKISEQILRESPTIAHTKLKLDDKNRFHFSMIHIAVNYVKIADALNEE